LAKTRTHSRAVAPTTVTAAPNRGNNLAATLAMLGLLGVTPLAVAPPAVLAADEPPAAPPAPQEPAAAPQGQETAPPSDPTALPPAPVWPPLWPPPLQIAQTPGVSPPPNALPPLQRLASGYLPQAPAWPPTWLFLGGAPTFATGTGALGGGQGAGNITPVKSGNGDGVKESAIKPVGQGHVQQFQGNSAERWLGSWARNLYVSGGSSLSSRSFSVQGSAQAQELYEQQNNALFFGTRQLGPFQQNMDLTIQGSLFNAFNVNARLTNTRQGNYLNQSFGFNYKSKGTEFNIGDVNASLPGNEFVTFARTLRGLTFGRDFGNGMRLQGVASITQAVTRRGTFFGNGTRGPFPLNTSYIIEGSERVRLNGRDLQRGSDYVIDYLIGQITFQGGLIVNPEDTVEYTYEAQNFNSTPGILGGLRWEMPLGEGNQIGFTWLQQKSTSGSRGTQEIVERFPVVEDLSYPYNLASIIEPGTPVEIRYLEQLLVENVDYQLNRDQRFFRLLRRFPPDTAFNGTLSLSARYRPVRQSSVGGDRSVLGIDGSYKLNQNVDFNLQLGQSGGQQNQSGNAMSLTTTFRSDFGGRDGALSGSLNWRDIGAGYSNIDSVAGAFQRAEKGIRGSLNFAPTSYLQITSSLNQTKLASTSFNTGGTDANNPASLIWNDNRNFNLGFSLTLPNLPKLDFSHAETTQKALVESGTTSKFSSQQLNLNWQKGIVGLSASLGRTASRGRTVFTTGYTNPLGGLTTGSLIGDYTNGLNTSHTDSASNNSRFRISLNPASWISVVGSLGFSKTKYGSTSLTNESGSTTDARDSSIGVSLPLNSRLAFTLNYVESSNGRTATGNSNPNNGGGTVIDNSIAGQRTRTYGLNAHYIPWDNLDLNFDLSRSLQLIPGYDNTNNNTFQFTASYTPDPRISILANVVSQDVQYIGTQQGNSGNKSYSLSATAGPFGKLTYTASYQFMDTGSLLYNTGSSVIPGIGDTGGSLTNYLSQNQNLTIWSLRADYPIGPNRSIFLQWQSLDSRSPGSGNGTMDYYTASNYRRGAGTLGLAFRLSELLNLTFDVNLIDMSDRERPDYSYRARALNMDLSARF